MLNARMIGGGVLLAILAVSCSSLVARRMSVRKVEELLQRHIPIGVHYTQAAGVLDSLDVEHSGFQAAEREILVIWRRSSVGVITEKSIQARLVFDQQGNLLTHEVTEVVTGT